MNKIDNLSTSNLNNENYKILKLKRELEAIFDNNYSFLGHGTSRYAAQKILQEGLVSRGNSLTETAISLFYSDKSYSDQTNDVFENILNWKHRNYKNIVVIAIPNAPKGVSGGMNYFNGIFEELSENKVIDVGVQGADRKYFIPPKFIKGFIDVNNLKFIKNDAYDPYAKVIPTPPVKTLKQKTQKKVTVLVPKPNEDKNELDIW